MHKWQNMLGTKLPSLCLVEMLLGYTSKPNDIIKVRNDNKTMAYTLSDFGQGFDLQNEFEEHMTLTEKSLFDILDEFFKREF